MLVYLISSRYSENYHLYQRVENKFVLILSFYDRCAKPDPSGNGYVKSNLQDLPCQDYVRFLNYGNYYRIDMCFKVKWTTLFIALYLLKPVFYSRQYFVRHFWGQV